MAIDFNNPKHRVITVAVFVVVTAGIFTALGYYLKPSKATPVTTTPIPTVSPSPSPSPSQSPSPRASATASKESSEVSKLKEEKAALQSQLDSANQTISNKNSGISTAKAYNSFLEYLTQVIDAHDGFTGWTDAEYQVGREKAQATGNQTFVDTVDTAWNNQAIDVTTRVINVYRGIVSGISGALN